MKDISFIKSINLLAISKLDGGSYNIDSILNAIKTITDWCLRVGIALAGVSLVVGFIMYAVARIIQTMFGIVGIILAISLVNLIIGLF